MILALETCCSVSIASAVICDICMDEKTWTENRNNETHTQTHSRFVNFI